jgi:hypothetical protein
LGRRGVAKGRLTANLAGKDRRAVILGDLEVYRDRDCSANLPVAGASNVAMIWLGKFRIASSTWLLPTD